VHSSNKRVERIESVIQISILLVIGGMAGAVSFTHVHDWTMQHVPAGTGDWFGWTNAVISELTPTAAGLEIRRRKRTGISVAYPMAVLIAAAALSIAAQLAVAKPTPSGWLLNVVPALAFLALTKLALSGSKAPAGTAVSATTQTNAIDDTSSADLPTVEVTKLPQVPEATTERPAIETSPEAATTTTTVPDELIQGARMALFAHRQRSEHPITPAVLADHLSIGTDVAAALLHHLDGTHGSRP
jgi:hypothetical protein